MQQHFNHEAQDEGVVVHQLMAEEIQRPSLGTDPLVSEVDYAVSSRDRPLVAHQFFALHCHGVGDGATCEGPATQASLGAYPWCQFRVVHHGVVA